MVSGHYQPEEHRVCDECGCSIGDYVICDGITRCVGCWVEYDVERGCTDKEEDIEIQEQLDVEAFSVIQRLYDKTFKDLVNR